MAFMVPADAIHVARCALDLRGENARGIIVKSVAYAQLGAPERLAVRHFLMDLYERSTGLTVNAHNLKHWIAEASGDESWES